MTQILKIGTRGSELALWQARHVAALIEKTSGVKSELTIIKTSGDMILDRPLSDVGGKGLFVKEIEEALLSRQVDLAVHSMKDVPAEMPEGLILGVTMEREDPRDVFVSIHYPSLRKLPTGAKLGTSSLRRVSQVRRIRPDLVIVPVRGNVGTRLRKLEEGQVDALLLAGAGMKRLGLEHKITEWLLVSDLLPAIGQGALGLEYRESDTITSSIASRLFHSDTHIAVSAERGVLKSLAGGCQLPVAAYATVKRSGWVQLEARVMSLSGDRMLTEKVTGPSEEAMELGLAIGQTLLEKGGKEILDEIRLGS
ncbi:hydroxymethylbilane synthase [Leptospirillum ferrooxidans]|jgi:hydroxymethylbilane synthase|uniref:Porphobilinogen deaminase n=1 Tax=Leptospirillum ferrooxidans (strain C2-3) TaxID=1162668 RepID=I0IM65_LEPFC|nr:hydroxymethylbilane synthase [Leptospirillum ferrooxidans]BAM06364.1 putative porphobilinogen deaminase [Leptospirillum ferrooxidans C2-3]